MRIELSTWPAVEDYFQRGNDLVVLAIGSTEEHGRHNPLGTDTLAPNLLLDKIEAASSLRQFPSATPMTSWGSRERFR